MTQYSASGPRRRSQNSNQVQEVSNGVHLMVMIQDIRLFSFQKCEKYTYYYQYFTLVNFSLGFFCIYFLFLSDEGPMLET